VLARHFSQLGRALCAKAVLRPPRRRRAG
jgi:hypothetical protein